MFTAEIRLAFVLLFILLFLASRGHQDKDTVECPDDFVPGSEFRGLSDPILKILYLSADMKTIRTKPSIGGGLG
jgi:hypothetical protein